VKISAIATKRPGADQVSQRSRQQTASGGLPPKKTLWLIGPEGDFSEEEIKKAIDRQFIAVELGEHRLRSETAALAAVAILTLL
jgi:16S rRNA (uracil1498-N3)-methyltransferase